MKKRFSAVIGLVSLIVAALGPAILVSARPALQPGTCTIEGNVYRDFNASGEQDALEPGVAGIIVTAFNAAGSAISTATTDSDGSYTLNQLPDADEVRLEFSNLPAYLRYGPTGSSSSTSVVFVTCGTNVGTIDLAVANPGQHCDIDPNIVTTCFAVGEQTNNSEPVLVSVPYTAGSTDLTTTPVGTRFDGSNIYLALADEIGSTWGVAYRRQTDTLYVGAFLKRHAGFGPQGPGAIYAIDMSNGGVQLLTSLTAAGGGEALHTDGTPYPDRPGFNPWLIDIESYNLVGKRGLGDMAMSDDDNTLYVINLFDRRLYSIPVDNPGAASSVAVPTSLPGCPASGDARPFAVSFHDGLVYVGITCTAESSQSSSDLRAYVYSHDPAGGGFSLELNIPLDYPRGCIDSAVNVPGCETDYPAEWLPWIEPTDPPTWPLDRYVGFTITYPQPWLSSIDFDNNGDMILGIRDRFGDMAGNFALSTITDDTTLYNTITGGDILRACLNAAGDWVLENNASCGGVSTAGAGNDNGPGGGEFYFQENLTGFHDELSMGSVLIVPGQPEMVSTLFDPIPINSELFDGGFRWYNNQNGQTVRAYRVYDGESGSLTAFGKANGLGGLEALCPPAPIEIGNRVWFDLDGDGIQDPGEQPIAGVTVNLYDANNNLIATTVTNAQGEYIFTSRTDGVQFNTDYSIRLDNPADYDPGGPLFEWFLTLNNSGPDQRDSDAILLQGFPTINLNTGGPGDNNHTYDFGFTQILITPTSDTPQTPGVPGTPGTPGIPPGCEPRLDKSVNPPFAQVGDLATWTIVVSNPCDSEITNLTLTDTIPDGLEIISVNASAGTVTQDGQRIAVAIDSIAPNGQITVTVQTRIVGGPDATFIYNNTAFLNGYSDTAQLVIAGELVRTGETPWWRLLLLSTLLALLVAGGRYWMLRRTRT